MADGLQRKDSNALIRVLLPGLAAVVFLLLVWQFVPPKYFLIAMFVVVGLLALAEVVFEKKFFLKSHDAQNENQDNVQGGGKSTKVG